MFSVKSKLSPEFINRLDEILFFSKLGKSHISKIVEIQLNKLRKRLLSNNIFMEWNEKVITTIALSGYDPEYGARPIKRKIRIIVEDEDGVPDNFTIFSASKLDQISSGFENADHGIFSYYLMKGLEGNADTNKDKKITNGELLAYMDQNVSQKASEYGRQQNPSLAGDPDKVLINYR